SSGKSRSQFACTSDRTDQWQFIIASAISLNYLQNSVVKICTLARIFRLLSGWRRSVSERCISYYSRIWCSVGTSFSTFIARIFIIATVDGVPWLTIGSNYTHKCN
uniref:G-protein coupled receptors family 1 profile domain-containing protein n=1 Tax=Parascaris univalens TaxID=6257 RepID=A0A915ABR2_PARUN